jgi:ectoine hydroxylase-related dioxygenase (phytanoyl-CoA dioxygenase family)
MEVIARSHQYGLIEHVRVNNYLGGSVSYLLIPEEATPSGERVQCQVRVGGVLLTQKETVHRSGPNRTDHIRWSLDLRYSNPALPTGRPHVPGFIAGSRAHPESVAKSHLDWLRLMESSQMT